MPLVWRILGLLNLANGAWMLLAPEAWYRNLPARVPDTGPFNAHFVQDIGSVYTAIGIGFWLAALRPRLLPGVLLAAVVFYVLHAGVHVADLVSGRLPARHWLIDLPGVFLPAILLLVLLLARPEKGV